MFKNLIIEIISIFEQIRNVVMYSLSELQKNDIKIEKKKRKAQKKQIGFLRREKNLPEKVRRTDDDDTDQGQYTETEKITRRAAKIYDGNRGEKTGEIRLLRVCKWGLIIPLSLRIKKGLRTRLTPKQFFCY